MKIFVTGHRGYLGSEFLKKYSGEFEVVGYDLEDGEMRIEQTRALKVKICPPVSRHKPFRGRK